MFVPRRLYCYNLCMRVWEWKEGIVSVFNYCDDVLTPVAVLQRHPCPLMHRGGQILQSLKTWRLKKKT